ncbi:MAG: hypothetical protein ACM37W_21875 [Actinomycetota bacterium]
MAKLFSSPIVNLLMATAPLSPLSLLLAIVSPSAKVQISKV